MLDQCDREHTECISVARSILFLGRISPPENDGFSGGQQLLDKGLL